MVIYFKTGKLQKTCSSEKMMTTQWGPRMARKLQQRLMELQAANTLAEVSRLPPSRCHELIGDLKGKLSVDLEHPYRLVFEPAHNPPPTKSDGGLDWAQVTKIVVVAVMDTH